MQVQWPNNIIMIIHKKSKSQFLSHFQLEIHTNNKNRTTKEWKWMMMIYHKKRKRDWMKKAKKAITKKSENGKWTDVIDEKRSTFCVPFWMPSLVNEWMSEWKDVVDRITSADGWNFFFLPSWSIVLVISIVLLNFQTFSHNFCWWIFLRNENRGCRNGCLFIGLEWTSNFYKNI